MVQAPSEEDEEQLFDSGGMDLDQLETFGRDIDVKSKTDVKMNKNEELSESESESDEDDTPQVDGANDQRGRGRPRGRSRGKSQSDKGAGEDNQHNVDVRQSARLRNLDPSKSTVGSTGKDNEGNTIQTRRGKVGSASKVEQSPVDTNSPPVKRGRGRPPKRASYLVHAEESDEFDSASDIGSPKYVTKTKTKSALQEDKKDQEKEVELSQSPGSISAPIKGSPRVLRGRGRPSLSPDHKVQSGEIHSEISTKEPLRKPKTLQKSEAPEKTEIPVSQSSTTPGDMPIVDKESPKVPRGRGRPRKIPSFPISRGKSNEEFDLTADLERLDNRQIKNTSVTNPSQAQSKPTSLLRSDISDDTQSEEEALVIDCDTQSPSRGNKEGTWKPEDAPASPEAPASPDVLQSPTNKPLTAPKIIPLSPYVSSAGNEVKSPTEAKVTVGRRQLRSSVDLSEIPSSALAMSPRKRKKSGELENTSLQTDVDTQDTVQTEYVQTLLLPLCF